MNQVFSLVRATWHIGPHKITLLYSAKQGVDGLVKKKQFSLVSMWGRWTDCPPCSLTAKKPLDIDILCWNKLAG